MNTHGTSHVKGWTIQPNSLYFDIIFFVVKIFRWWKFETTFCWHCKLWWDIEHCWLRMHFLRKIQQMSYIVRLRNVKA